LGAEFPGILKQRLNDSNKNLQIIAVEITGALAVAMGKPFEKYAKIFTAPIIAVLSDNKANVRAAGVAALENIRKTCTMEPMAGAFGTGLANESPALRKEFLTWFSTAIKEEPEASKYDFTGMISPLFSCLQDRNADVRKAAQASLPELVSVVGYDAVAGKTSELKAAQRQTIMPLVEAARGSAPSASANASIKKRPESMQTSDDHPRAPAASASTAPASRMKTLTRKKAGGIPAPRSQAASQAAATEDSSAPVLTSDSRAKQVRAKKENRWQFDAPRPDVIEGLKALFDANMSPEVTALLFSTSQYAERDRLNGLSMLNECLSSPEICSSKYHIDFSDMKQRYVANSDLILKYLTIRFFDTNTSMLIKCLEITENLIAVLDEEGYNLSEYEAVSFLPFLLNKVGDPKEVMRARIRAILKSMCRIYPASKMFNYLLDSAASSKNAKARAECLEEVGALIQRNGISVMLPNKALPLIATHIGDRDSGVRNASLNAIAQAYILIGDAVMKHMTRLGDKEKSMLEERLKVSNILCNNE
jgi:cytoskeleton-associated protein 5